MFASASRGSFLQLPVLVHVTHCRFITVLTGLVLLSFRYDLQNWVGLFRAIIGRIFSQGILKEFQLLLNAARFKTILIIILRFFRGFFGVEDLATWSLLVLEVTGDWKVRRFVCLACKSSVVEDVIQAWV